MNDVILVDTTQIDQGTMDRAAEVQSRLKAIGSQLEDHFLDVCGLLEEAQEQSYHVCHGYGRFGDWVEQGSGLDISARQAYYYVRIAKTAKQLGLTRADIKKAKISKLKEIFSLDPLEQSEQMKQLVAGAGEDTLETVKDKVRQARAKSGQGDFVNMRFKLESTAKEVVDEAFDLARQNHGSIVNQATGEIDEVSDSKCLELVCAEYLTNPNNREENEFGAGHESIEDMEEAPE